MVLEWKWQFWVNLPGGGGAGQTGKTGMKHVRKGRCDWTWPLLEQCPAAKGIWGRKVIDSCVPSIGTADWWGSRTLSQSAACEELVLGIWTSSRALLLQPTPPCQVALHASWGALKGSHWGPYMATFFLLTWTKTCRRELLCKQVESLKVLVCVRRR